MPKKIKTTPVKERKELLADLYNSLQNSLTGTISGVKVSGAIDNLENNFFEIEKYCQSLQTAVDVITEIEGKEEVNTALTDLADYCAVTLEGIHRARHYLNHIKMLGSDLDTIKGQMLIATQTIYQEGE